MKLAEFSALALSELPASRPKGQVRVVRDRALSGPGAMVFKVVNPRPSNESESFRRLEQMAETLVESVALPE